MVSLLAFAGVALLQSDNQQPRSPGGSSTPTLHRVIDGDTIEVRFPSGIETVRLLGIDTPETVHPTKPIECHGPEASASLKRLLPPGTTIRLERDQQFRDHFGRMLAYVYRFDDDRFVNLDQVATGMAEANIIAPNRAFSTVFQQAEARARVNNLGRWAAC